MREQETAFAALFIMSVWNVLLGLLMIGEVVTVVDGMLFAFIGMAGICFASKKALMGDEQPWESPKQYKERKENAERS
jgi:hypothetical protein